MLNEIRHKVARPKGKQTSATSQTKQMGVPNMETLPQATGKRPNKK